MVILMVKHSTQEIAISEFKAKCLGLLEQVRKTKTPIRVTRFGRPIADVVPISREADAGDWLGSLADVMTIEGDVVSPVIEESDLEALQD
jgi:prevent-host-death family protein